MKTLLEGARRAGPYLLVELLLPGGSLIAAAMLIVAYRRKHAKQPKGITS